AEPARRLPRADGIHGHFIAGGWRGGEFAIGADPTHQQQLFPIKEGDFCVETTAPVTRARCMIYSCLIN
ncbi:hypothetical protein SEEE1392_23030, partial [Salmonella enterica subsp. enterica serovar Enteritidis str. 648901 39-2]